MIEQKKLQKSLLTSCQPRSIMHSEIRRTSTCISKRLTETGSGTFLSSSFGLDLGLFSDTEHGKVQACEIPSSPASGDRNSQRKQSALYGSLALLTSELSGAQIHRQARRFLLPSNRKTATRDGHRSQASNRGNRNIEAAWPHTDMADALGKQGNGQEVREACNGFQDTRCLSNVSEKELCLVSKRNSGQSIRKGTPNKKDKMYLRRYLIEELVSNIVAPENAGCDALSSRHRNGFFTERSNGYEAGNLEMGVMCVGGFVSRVLQQWRGISGISNRASCPRIQ